MSEFILVGRVSGLFGTRGWVKVFSHTRPRDNLLRYDPWFVRGDDDWQRYAVRAARPHHGGIIAQLEGIEDRDQAALLVRRDVAIERAQLTPAVPGEIYWSDLLGLRVANREGQDLGEVAGLLETGAHDVLRVKGEIERLIPYVPEVYVLDIDLAARRLLVDWHVDD